MTAHAQAVVRNIRLRFRIAGARHWSRQRANRRSARTCLGQQAQRPCRCRFSLLPARHHNHLRQRHAAGQRRCRCTCERSQQPVPVAAAASSKNRDRPRPTSPPATPAPPARSTARWAAPGTCTSTAAPAMPSRRSSALALDPGPRARRRCCPTWCEATKATRTGASFTPRPLPTPWPWPSTWAPAPAPGKANSSARSTPRAARPAPQKPPRHFARAPRCVLARRRLLTSASHGCKLTRRHPELMQGLLVAETRPRRMIRQVDFTIERAARCALVRWSAIASELLKQVALAHLGSAWRIGGVVVGIHSRVGLLADISSDRFALGWAQQFERFVQA